MIERVLRLNQIFFLLVVNRDTFYLRCIPDCTVMNSRTVKKHAKNECVGLAVMFDCIYCNQSCTLKEKNIFRGDKQPMEAEEGDFFYNANEAGEFRCRNYCPRYVTRALRSS